MSTMTRSFVLLIPILALCSVASLQGSPITYDFNGRFDSPVDGATTFSGSFTYDSSLPFYPNAQQSSSIAYYGDAPGTPGKLISARFAFGNSNSNNLGTISSTELIVWHDKTTDEMNLDVSFTKNGTTSRVVIGMLNDNTISPGQFTSTSPPPSLDLAKFNQLAQLIYDPTGNSSGGTIVGTITGLVPAGTTLPPVPPPIPEPTTCVVIIIGFSGLLVAQRSGQKRAGR
jgi:hypothetical protein